MVDLPYHDNGQGVGARACRCSRVDLMDADAVGFLCGVNSRFQRRFQSRFENRLENRFQSMSKRVQCFVKTCIMLLDILLHEMRVIHEVQENRTRGRD